MNDLNYEKTNFLGLKVNITSREMVLNYMVSVLKCNEKSTIGNVNVHAMNLAQQDSDFKRTLTDASMVFVDGFGVILGGKLAGVNLGQRITPADFIDELLSLCAEHGWSVFWLGDTDDVCETFVEKVKAKVPDIQIAGYHHGFFDRQGEANDLVVDKINASGAQVLLVGMSMPIQEKWLWQNKDKLNTNLRLAVGGLARIYTGHIPRGPKWMTDNGFEWLYRMCMQPKYTWKRYLLGNPLFMLRVLLWRLKGKPSNQ